jgi:nucleoside-triphosphatase
MGHTLILTGTPGVGKTTLIKATIEQLGDRAGGFYTEEILGPGGRKGFKLITLDGEWGIMAHVDFKSKSNVGRYGVEVHIVDRLGAGSILSALETKPIVVIDEIGKMELFSSQFQSAVLKAVGSSKIVLASAMIDNHPWVMALKAFPGVTVWEVTKKNRGKLAEQTLAWINGRLIGA